MADDTEDDLLVLDETSDEDEASRAPSTANERDRSTTSRSKRDGDDTLPDHWTVLVVDDDEAVHAVTRLALEGLEIEGRVVRLHHVYSGVEARAALNLETSYALVLLDVVMETDSAGLDLARWIREVLADTCIQIVLRTGQPGTAPEEAVMANYDIHDYYAKTEITAGRLRNTVIGSVRAWRDLRTSQLQRMAIERAQETIVASLREKETLLKEIHHRVKNNLQIVSSLLELQIDRVPSEESRTLIQETVLQVRSMALIHQHLYGVDSLDRVDLGNYVRVLAESLRCLLAPSVRLEILADETSVVLDEAIPAGLILNELLTNVFKYGVRKRDAQQQAGAARRTGASCDVRVEIVQRDGMLSLSVTDSGPGLPEGLILGHSASLGLYLVRALTRQIRGELRYDYEDGSRFVVEFRRSALPSDAS